MNKNKSVLASAFGNQKRWINWRYEKDDNGKETKVPYQKNLTYKASTTNASTWSTYEDVLKISSNIGIVFTNTQMLLGIDFDHCLMDGKIVHPDHTTIERFLAEMNTYVEISPSGYGLHAYLVLTTPLDLISNKKAPYELYTSGRFFTVTNNQYRNFGELRIVTPQEALDLLSIIGYPWKGIEKTKNQKTPVATLLNDEVVLSKMFVSKNGNKIKALYNGDTTSYDDDDSRADMALCSYLAFWTGKNHEQMDRIWRNSPLGSRQKTQQRKDYRDRTIREAIETCHKVYSESNPDIGDGKNDSTRTKITPATTLLDHIFSRDDVILFHDEKGNGHISFGVNGHREVMSLKSKAMRVWLARELYHLQKGAQGTDVITSVLQVLEGKARFEGEEIKLDNRVSFRDGELWYDLTNENWEAVKITKDGWEIVPKPPIIFKRYSHHKKQVMPSKNGDAALMLKYVNIKNLQHKLLYMVSLISYFIPSFPHVMMTIFGVQGATKSTTSKISRSIVDPSLIDVSSFPKSNQDLVQALDHHYFMFFDNVSYISEDQSDTLCKAITGGGHTTRELYSDDEDIIRILMRCIEINGINLVTTRPDLLERSLLLELERVSPSERKTETELYTAFNNDLPLILGGIFDVLAKTLKTYPEIKLSSQYRMADWVKYGCAIAEALGYKKEEFLEAYENNVRRQTEMLLSENIVATAIITFMEGRDRWVGTSTQLLRELLNHAPLVEIDTREKYWPKGANALSRRLNELSTPLKKVGISIVISTNGSERYISIEKDKPDNTDDTDGIF